MAQITESKGDRLLSQSSGLTLALALIPMIGGISIALIGNWDKIFHTTVTASYDGYHTSGDFDTEMRYFLEITGQRAAYDQNVRLGFDVMMNQINQAGGVPPDKLAKIREIALKSVPPYDEIVTQLIPIWRSHFSLDQIQELNKFYSTPLMRKLVAEQPAIGKELKPALDREMSEVMQRVQKNLQEAAASGQI